MKFLLFSHLQNARDSLRANRMRTFLTIIGVAIGVTSIVAILSLAHGASTIVSGQVDQLGGNIAVVRPTSGAPNNFSSVVNQQAHGAFGISSLTSADVLQLAKLPHVKAVAPIMILPGQMQADSTAPNSSLIVATNRWLIEIANLELSSGSFNDNTQNLAVVGAQLSIDLFGTENSIGKNFKLRGQEFRVGGTLKRSHEPVNFNGIDFNSAALVSMSQAKSLLPSAQIQQIDIQADSVANLDSVIINANKTLLKQHNNQPDFSVLAGEQISEPSSQLFFAIGGVITAIAAISLLVGGIGIMNIMLVNVAERTREIGIRKALGATHSDIALQFLIESLGMGIIGGTIGVLGGFALAFVISLFLTFNPTISWQTALIGLAISAMTGLFFGFYPALKAARKNPIESLRQQN